MRMCLLVLLLVCSVVAGLVIPNLATELFPPCHKSVTMLGKTSSIRVVTCEDVAVTYSGAAAANFLFSQ